MPPCAQWEQYFEPESVFTRLGLQHIDGDVVEYGCGYGTFTLAIAQRTFGRCCAIDLDAQMTTMVAQRALRLGIENIDCVTRDFVANGSGLADGSQALALLFNILHFEDPVALLREARRVLRDDGQIAVIHWNYDSETPRGPPMAIRPRPENYPNWAAAAGLNCGQQIDLPPYHYGFVMHVIT